MHQLIFPFGDVHTIWISLLYITPHKFVFFQVKFWLSTNVSGNFSCFLQVGCVQTHVVPAAKLPHGTARRALRCSPGSVLEKSAKLANVPGP